MGKMIEGKCSVCGEVIRARTQPNFIKKMGEHFRKEHPEAFSRRISRGLKASKNPTELDTFMKCLNGDPDTALSIYARWTERQYQDTKRVMDALKPVLPPNILAGWTFIEAVHDNFDIRLRR